LSLKHGPNRSGNYRQIHETCTDQLLRRGFVEEHNLRYEAVPGHICILGQIACQGGIMITVEKYLSVAAPPEEVLDGADAYVETVLYAYNASVRGHGTFLRYDNCHPHAGHDDWNHRHRLDWRDESKEEIDWVGQDWPTLMEFVDEVEGWYWKHRDELPGPESGAPGLDESFSRRLALPFMDEEESEDD